MATKIQTIRLARPLLLRPPHPLPKIRSFHALLRPPTGTPHLHLHPKPPSLAPHIQTRSFADLPAVLTTALSLTQSLFTTIHTATHTPWYLTIPLLALSVNLVARLPLTLYTRRVNVRRARLTPLIKAWRARHTIAVPPSPARDAEVARRMAATTKRVYRTFGVQRWRDFLGFGVFPVWLLGIEALRRMCGGPRGLLGSVVFGAGKGAPEGEGGAAAAAAVVGEAGVEEGLAAAAAAATEGVDMSLATGGCLWFPDLTAADPLHVLPFALSAVLVMNVLPGTRAGKMLVFGMGRGKTVAVGGETPLRLTRAFLIMALAIGPCTMDLPAAIHLYWLSSASLTLLQAKMIPYLLPMPMTDSADMRPCTENEMRFIRPTRGDEGEKP